VTMVDYMLSEKRKDLHSWVGQNRAPAKLDRPRDIYHMVMLWSGFSHQQAHL
jgi:hypothetical protein